MNEQKSKQHRFNRIPNIPKAYFAYFVLPLAVIFPLRQIGFLQPLESIALDTVMRSRPTEPVDERITIVGIDEEDLKYLRNRKELVGDSISDAALAQTLTKIFDLKPAAIGLDVMRDIPMGTVQGRERLKQVVSQNQNIVEGYKRGNPDPISAVLGLPLDRVGFNDDPLDTDGRARRTILSIPEQELYSLSFQVSRLYLESHQLPIDSINDRQILINKKNKKIDSLQLTPATYPGENNSGELQLLVNYRNNPKPFNTISLRDIFSGKLNSNLIEGRIVLIGYTAHSKRDFDYSNAIKIEPKINSDRIPTLLYGVEYHAHITSQLLSQILDDRPDIYPLQPILDILWLLGCTSLGLVISKLLPINDLSVRITIGVLINAIGIGLIIYLLILCGIWVPIAATIVSLIVSTPALVTAYERERQMAVIARGQLDVLEMSRKKLHEIPSQTIGRLLKIIPDGNLPSDIKIKEMLNQILSEIKNISEELLEKYQEGDNHPLLKYSQERNSLPLNQMLRVTYENKIADCNKLPDELQNYLNRIDYSISTVEFNPVPDDSLTHDDKEKICHALSECLTNIGKHAEGATRLVIQTKLVDGICSLEISDNGKNYSDLSKPSCGTTVMEQDARRLGGKFIRIPNQPRGCKCIFSWQVSRSRSIAGWIASIRNS
jgi:CHASE2 domain-containing sensor protein